LIFHIDNLNVWENIGKPEVGTESAPPGVHPDRVANLQESEDNYNISEQVSSKLERNAIGYRNRQASRVIKRKANKKDKRKLKSFEAQTGGINGEELRRRKRAGECQRCVWPQDRKGGHKTLDCFWWKKTEEGTAPLPKKRNYKE
jgi:hypothetical protein